MDKRFCDSFRYAIFLPGAVMVRGILAKSDRTHLVGTKSQNLAWVTLAL